MDGWELIRHKEEYKEPEVGRGWRYSGSPAAVYWARKTEDHTYRIPGRGPEKHRREKAVEIRSPLNAAGFGSQEPGEIASPDMSARSGVIPYSAVQRLYEQTTPEELGLTVGGGV